MEAFVDRYLARYRSFKTSWNYEDGCVLKGCADLYAATGEEKYRRFVLSYLDGRVTREGAIPSFDTGTYNIDSVNCGKVLFFALDETGQERYRRRWIS
jgi:unsaturated rhamnogalacturonyl hydrolase